MSYGLSKFIKNILPRRLFYRALLIVAVPIIVLQLIITIVFFDSLWIKTNKGMTRALVGEMKTFITAYDNGKYNNNDLSGLFSVYLDLNVEYKNDKLFEKPLKERWFSPINLKPILCLLFSLLGVGFPKPTNKSIIFLDRI